MDDDGQKQRLLDVIGDPHALETFLENFPSSSFPTDGGLLWQGLDSPRFDNVTSSTDSGLVSSCLDNLVFDGQFLGQVRGGNHPLNHSQVPAHVLQQVLPSPTLPAAPQGAHAQQQQQQQHQQPQHQHHQQHPLQSQQNVALQTTGAPHVAGVPNSSGGEGSRENDPPTLQQLLASPASFPSQQQTQAQTQTPPQPQSHHPSGVGAVGHGLPPSVLTSSASRMPAALQQAQQLQQQLPVQPSPRPVAVRPHVSPASKSSQGGGPTTVQPNPQVISQAAPPAPPQVMSSGVQLVGGANQVITTGGQIITSASPQLLQGTQLLQAPGSTQVVPAGQIIPGGQVLHNGQVIQGSQVLHGAHMLPGGHLLQGGQVIQGGQVLQGGQLIHSGQVINSGHLITTTHMVSTGLQGLNAATAPIYVTPTTPAVQQQTHTVTLHQSGQSPTPTASPFSVPSKSPGAALPRTSPSPSSYHPTTPSPHTAVPSPAPYTTRSPAPSPHNNISAMRSPAPPTPSPAATPTSQTHSTITSVPQLQPPGVVQGVMSNVGMVQSLVPQLPLSQVVGSNGMVLPQPGVQQQTTSGVKQVVPGGQLIQLVSSPQPTQPRQTPVSLTHKPIQPKQPQLLPKPPQTGVVGQSAQAPPGKTLIGTRPVTPGSQQPIVIGAAGQQATTTTMMAGQQGLGGFVINPSLLQSSLQQPILIQQPNGVLLVRPSGPSGAGGAPGQALLVPVPGQHQMVAAGGKPGQHQTVVFSGGSGQAGPAFVIPQNVASNMGAPGVMGAAQGARGPQPIIRLVAPQAPLQLQQIQTPNGPTLVAVPAGQAVNLQGLLTTGGATMRALAPPLASGPLQLAPSSVTPPNLAPVATMGHIQMPGGGQQLQVSVSGTPLQLATSLPSSLPSVITTTKQTVIDENVAPASVVTAAAEVGTPHQTVSDPNKNTKKKSKKKKKEKEPRDDKVKSKGGSINLNDILKETGIVGDLMLFDEQELGLGGEGVEGIQSTATSAGTLVTQAPVMTPATVVHSTHVAPAVTSTLVVTSPPVVTPTRVVTHTPVVSHASVVTSASVVSPTPVVTPAPVATPRTVVTVSDTNVTFAAARDAAGHIVVGTSHPPAVVGMSSSLTTGTVTSSSTSTNVMSSPSGMCFTLDSRGKVILGSDTTRTQLSTSSTTAATQVGGLVVPSCHAQVQVIGGSSGADVASTVASVASGGSIASVMSGVVPTIMTCAAGVGGTGINTLPVGSLPSFTQLLTTPTQVTSSVVVHGPSVATRTRSIQLPHTTTKVSHITTKTQPGADISRVAQNTHLLQALHLPASEKSAHSGQPLLTSLLSGQEGGPSNSGDHPNFPVQVSVGEGTSMLAVVSMGGMMTVPEGGVVSNATSNSSPAPLNILVPSHASQVPQSSAVIVSSSATNSVVSGAIISHKPFVTSNSALIPQTLVTNSNAENVPMSRGHSQTASSLQQQDVPSHTGNISAYITKNVESNSSKQHFPNEYVATLHRGQNLIDHNKNKSKSNKKKKKDRDVDTVLTTTASPIIMKQSLQERLKANSSSNTSGQLSQQLPLAPLPNGLSNPALKTAPHSLAITTSAGPVSIALGEAGVNADNTSVIGSSMPVVTTVPFMPSVATNATSTIQSPAITTTPMLTTTTTNTTSPLTPSPVVIAGQKQQFKQVKHLILSPHNQEALKKVHSQIQALQSKKSDQDQACLQQLYSEYRKLMATGKHVTVTSSPQQPQIAPAPSQPTPVRYSHPVGHKIITLTQFRQPLKHLPQEQQRQMLEQSKVLQRWKDPSSVSTASTNTSSVTHLSTTPHLSPSSQISNPVVVHTTTTSHLSPNSQNISSSGTRVSTSPMCSPSMPTITTSVSSPTVPTTSTTVSTCSPNISLNSSSKATPPQCSPVSSTTPSGGSQPLISGPSPPKSSVQTTVVLPNQVSSRPSPTSGTSEHSHSPVVQTKTTAVPAYSNQITREQLFEHQLKTDQNGALNPDYRTPFKNKIDACKRLIRYHVYSDRGPTPRDLTDSDSQFDVQGESLLKKFSNMKYKYQSLLIRDSLRRHASSETVMLYRLFVQEERCNVMKDKLDVQNGKIMDLPPPPPHWTSGEPLPPDPPFPWELEWEKQKIYSFDSWGKREEDEEDEDVEEEEEEEEEEVEDEDEEEMVTQEKEKVGEPVPEEQKEDKEDENFKVKEEDESQELKQEKDEFDESQEGEKRLQIFMENEEEEAEEENQEQEENSKKEKEEERTYDAGQKLPALPRNHLEYSEQDVTSPVTDDPCTKSEPEPDQELVICDSELGSSSAHNSPINVDGPRLDFQCDSWTNSSESVLKRIPDLSQSPKQHRTSEYSQKIRPNHETKCDIGEEDIYRRTPSPNLKIVSDRTERDKKRDRTEKERRKSDKSKDKDKDRGRDREKEDRPPKKLKIKLKSEERATVPPLRIRSEDRAVGLKLTLKKHEGSEGYYSVGEERKREYRVEQNDGEPEDAEKFLFDGEEVEDEDGDADGHGLKEVKVVLQDVLKDKRFKKQIEERSSKKRRKDRSDFRTERNERSDRNNSHWSNHSQHVYNSEREEDFMQQSNNERTWNHNSSSVEWPSGGEGASSADQSSDIDRTSRDYKSPCLNTYEDHYGQEYTSRHNHSQPYGHSGSQPRNSQHNYY